MRLNPVMLDKATIIDQLIDVVVGGDGHDVLDPVPVRNGAIIVLEGTHATMVMFDPARVRSLSHRDAVKYLEDQINRQFGQSNKYPVLNELSHVMQELAQ